MSSDAQRFLADILAHPDDDGPRLVFADWLMEQGDPRGELIVTQCQLEHATGGERMRLVNRASDLLYRQGTWLNELKEVVRGVETKRGFVYAIHATARVFAKSCGPWFEREPIEELRVIKPSPRDLATLRNAKHVAKLRSLVFLDPVRITAEPHVAALSELLAKANVRSLDLRLAIDDEVVTAMRDAFARLALPALESLRLRVRSSQSAVIVGALAAARLPALRRLAVPKLGLAELTSAFSTSTVTVLVD